MVNLRPSNFWGWYFYAQVFNSSEEVADAENYPDIRLFTVAQKWSATDMYELIEVEQQWTRPNKGTVYSLAN